MWAARDGAEFQGDDNSAALSSSSEMPVCGNSRSAPSDPFYSGAV